ncbi:MAG TPA: precorrin-4 C(11)-methyltransferase [Candidatus Omnitrophota bacterium]|nr:precorrin-4 C(11)-methyltransferase [Candidatus Omnitrophota bacterium]
MKIYPHTNFRLREAKNKIGVGVYFIGAGPGDPELLTLKAQRIIAKADIIIYAGSLVNKELLKFAKAKAAIYDSSSMTLQEAQKIILKAKGSNKIVARIHSGDPSIYSSIQEQIAWCEKEDIPYEVIPGVSSFCAAAASLKQELTLPDIAQTVIITRLSGRTKVPAKENLKALSRIRATLVIFLSIDKIGSVVKQLLYGYAKDTPAAVVSKASWPDEKIITGTLKDITQKVKREKISRQAIIFVGDVLKKRGFKKSRLYDKNFSHGYRKWS